MIEDLQAIRELSKHEGWAHFMKAMKTLQVNLIEAALRNRDPEKREAARHKVNMLNDEILPWLEKEKNRLEKALARED